MSFVDPAWPPGTPGRTPTAPSATAPVPVPAAGAPGPPGRPRTAVPAGWYTTNGAQRWWDGTSWGAWRTTPGQSASLTPSRPLALRPWRRFLIPAIPVMICAPFAAIVMILSSIKAPAAVVALGLPVTVLAGALWWLDRIEPEPADARVFAFAWGAALAIILAGTINTVVHEYAGTKLAATASAPVFEELCKALVLIPLIRRRLVTSTIDGIVYVFLAAAGFALVEDLHYFAMAYDKLGVDGFNAVVIGRGLFTPFAHPLFTSACGVAAAFVARRRPRWPTALAAMGGAYLTGVLLHACWNGLLGGVWVRPNPQIAGMTVLVSIAVFSAAVVIVWLARRSETREFERWVPALTQDFQLQPAEAALFTSSQTYLAYRNSLPRPRRAKLRELRAALHAFAAAQAIAANTGTSTPDDAAYTAALRADIQTLRRELLAGG